MKLSKTTRNSALLTLVACALGACGSQPEPPPAEQVIVASPPPPPSEPARSPWASGPVGASVNSTEASNGAAVIEPQPANASVAPTQSTAPLGSTQPVQTAPSSTVTQQSPGSGQRAPEGN